MIRQELLIEFARNFREWQADHFGDYDTETNDQLFCLDNDACVALGDEQ